MLDMHAHYYGGLIEALARRTERPCVTTGRDGVPLLHAMTATTRMGPAYTDIPTRRVDMARAGIAAQLITFPGALGLDVVPAAVAVPLVTGFNDHLAAVCRASQGRFVGLAGLPLDDVAQARPRWRNPARQLLPARRECRAARAGAASRRRGGSAADDPSRPDARRSAAGATR